MHIIYLGGGSVRNKDWIENVKLNFDSFSTGDILYYDYWISGDKNINFEIETRKLIELVKHKKDYCIFAKSIGSILALKCIYKKIINPKKLIICGLPFSFDLNNLSVPTTFIQNEFDPLFSFSELENILQKNKVKDYTLIKNTGIDTHDYEDFEMLSITIKNFFN